MIWKLIIYIFLRPRIYLLKGGGNIINIIIYIVGFILYNCVLISDLALVQIGSSYYIDIFPNGLI